MSESRPNLSSSISFTAPSSSTASAISRPLKRRLTSAPDLAFFTPAAQSFKPRPYTPNTAAVPSVTKPLPSTRSHASISLAQPTPAMDPSPSDPAAIFIHPPFVSFPSSHLHPEGLSYALMAANPEWFLDRSDFISNTPKTDNKNVIAYPPQLEPPRGWCPAKKKDLKALGAEGWPEGEEPRLRCTFCRRTYAGVNAKSMWRRHVYEKHKIAMANRREGADRSRVRGSNKENKHGYSGSQSDEGGRGSVKMDSMSPQARYEPLFDASSSGLISLTIPAGDELVVPSAPYIEQEEFPMPIMSVDFTEAQLTMPSISPPLTPRSRSPKAIRRSLSEPPSPSPKQHIIFPSPYNPLATPSFRHSPPRLPSDQPWRFPSPSHPLHSRARELCLGVVVRGGTSPSAKGILDSSPITPAIPHNSRNGAADSDNTDHMGSSPNIMRPSPRSLFGSGQSPFPSSSDRVEFGGYRSRVEESPLGRLMRHKNLHYRQKSSLSTFSEIGNDWFSDVSGPSSSSLMSSHELMTPIRLESEDPFTLYSSWVKEPKSANGKGNTKFSSPGGGSPVLRSSRLHEERAGETSPVGLGIGLMAPFAFPTPKSPTSRDLDENDFSAGFPSSPEEGRDEAEVERALAAAGPPGLPSKQSLRRAHALISESDESLQHDSDQYELSAPPLKRRRTIDTRG